MRSFREILDHFKQNKIHISETLSKDEEIKDTFHFHWFEHIVACRAIFIMAVFILLYIFVYQQLGWYNKAMVFLGPIFLVLLCFGTLICVAFGIFELLVLNTFTAYFLSLGIIISVVHTLYSLLELQTLEMVITNKRVICKRGILQLQTEELKLSKIESINVKQSIFGRIFNYATISFSGVGTAKVDFVGVENPWIVKSHIESIIKE